LPSSGGPGGPVINITEVLSNHGHKSALVACAVARVPATHTTATISAGAGSLGGAGSFGCDLPAVSSAVTVADAATVAVSATQTTGDSAAGYATTQNTGPYMLLRYASGALGWKVHGLRLRSSVLKV
jgi:hypothetical protein